MMNVLAETLLTRLDRIQPYLSDLHRYQKTGSSFLFIMSNTRRLVNTEYAIRYVYNWSTLVLPRKDCVSEFLKTHDSELDLFNDFKSGLSGLLVISSRLEQMKSMHLNFLFIVATVDDQLSILRKILGRTAQPRHHCDSDSAANHVGRRLSPRMCRQTFDSSGNFVLRQ
jgi:hypothetical protein